MRLDKFLKVSRILKRRTVANEACDNNRVEVNNRAAKAGLQLKVGDIVKIHFGNKSLTVRVLVLSEHIKKEDADSMYEVINE